MTKTHWKKEFNPDFLGAWSLDGEEKIVTIEKTGHSLVKSARDPQGEDCFVCHFKEFDKPMVLNSTNCKIIGKLHGNYIEDWIGKKIQLYTTNVKAFGDTVEALRVRTFIPKAATKKDEIKAEIKSAFKMYQGEDKETIRQELFEKSKSNADTNQYLTDVLKKLTA